MISNKDWLFSMLLNGNMIAKQRGQDQQFASSWAYSISEGEYIGRHLE
jgi:hypothetical protein